MALIFNGVTIPEDVAGALSFNGSNIEVVIFNGLEVWKQNLFKGIWSGNTYSINNGYGQGLNVSGQQVRLMTVSNYVYSYGVWVNSTSNGMGTGNSLSGNSEIVFENVRFLFYGLGTLYSTINFTVSGGFTGVFSYGYSTSGGSVRAQDTTTGSYGDWITLT